MSESFTNVPPVIISRNEHGLLSNVNYVFGTDGKVDWRKMIKPEYLYPFKEYFLRRQQDVPKTIEGLPDEALVIRLGGIKELAQLRGFSSVTPRIVVASPNFVSAECTISWIGNCDTEGRSISFGDSADAHPGNVDGFAFNYLTTIAINRAFVRAVRNFLKVGIIGQEELGAKEETDQTQGASAADPINALIQALRSKGKTPDQLLNRMKKEGLENSETYQSLNDIPKMLILDLIEKIKSGAKSLKD